MDINAGLIVFNEKKAEDLVSEAELVEMFHCNVKSIKRAIDRGDLPMPATFIGGINIWTVGSIRRHAEARIDRASQETVVASQKITQLAVRR